MQTKTVSQSYAEFTHLVLTTDINAIGTVFGGRLMEWIDLAASVIATRHCRKIAVTASMDALHFISPIHLGDIVVLKGSVNYTHQTSMEIGVKIEVENPQTGERRHTASAYLTFVALDEDRRPTVVPALICETEEQKRRFEQARSRREERLKWKKSHQSGNDQSGTSTK